MTMKDWIGCLIYGIGDQSGVGDTNISHPLNTEKTVWISGRVNPTVDSISYLDITGQQGTIAVAKVKTLYCYTDCCIKDHLKIEIVDVKECRG
jgi:hypothetical protein